MLMMEPRVVLGISTSVPKAANTGSPGSSRRHSRRNKKIPALLTVDHSDSTARDASAAAQPSSSPFYDALGAAIDLRFPRRTASWGGRKNTARKGASTAGGCNIGGGGSSSCDFNPTERYEYLLKARQFQVDYGSGSGDYDDKHVCRAKMVSNINRDVSLDEEVQQYDVFRQLANKDESDKEEEEPQERPPASALIRRQALVPPRLLCDDDYTVDNEDAESGRNTSGAEGDSEERDSSVRSERWQSFSVIPPMQICPGDLLVYSQALMQRKRLLDMPKKSKNSFSFFKMLNRSKSESVPGLEDVLNSLPRCEFHDEQLSKYKGLTWCAFAAMFEQSDSSPDNSQLEDNSVSSEPDKSTSETDALTLAFGSISAATTTTADSTTTLTTTTAITTTVTTPVATTAPITASTTATTTTDPGIASIVSPQLSPTSQIEQFTIDIAAKNEQKRRQAFWDLFRCQCIFLYDYLMVLKNVFMEPLKKIQVEGHAMFAEPEILFGNLDELCCVLHAFCREYINIVVQDMTATGDVQTTKVLVKLFQKSDFAVSPSQAFHSYTLNYITALTYLDTLRSHTEFIEFEKWCQKDARCKKLHLTDLLVAPVQHITKIPVILKDIQAWTIDEAEKKQIAQVVETEEKLLRELDDKIKWLKNFERLLELQRNIIWPSVMDADPKSFVPEFLKPALSRQPCEKLIASPRRQLIYEGPLIMIEGNKPNKMYAILMTDLLIIARRKRDLRRKKSSIGSGWPSSSLRGNEFPGDSEVHYIIYQQPLSLDRIFLHDVSPQDAAANKLENAFVVVHFTRFQQIINVFTFQAQTEEIKFIWLTKLKTSQDRLKRSLQTAVLRNQS